MSITFFLFLKYHVYKFGYTNECFDWITCLSFHWTAGQTGDVAIDWTITTTLDWTKRAYPATQNEVAKATISGDAASPVLFGQMEPSSRCKNTKNFDKYPHQRVCLNNKGHKNNLSQHGGKVEGIEIAIKNGECHFYVVEENGALRCVEVVTSIRKAKDVLAKAKGLNPPPPPAHIGI